MKVIIDDKLELLVKDLEEAHHLIKLANALGYIPKLVC